eukprot:gene11443-34151_t
MMVYTNRRTGEKGSVGTTEENWIDMAAEIEQSALSRSAHKQPTIARKNYHLDLAGHNDVFQYRHSGGICPTEYKFVEQREPRTLGRATDESQRPQSARDSFFEANRGYAYYKVRDQSSNIF